MTPARRDGCDVCTERLVTAEYRRCSGRCTSVTRTPFGRTSPGRQAAAALARGRRRWRAAGAANRAGRSPLPETASAATAASAASGGRSGRCSGPTTCRCCTRDGAARSLHRPESTEIPPASRTPFRSRKGRCFRVLHVCSTTVSGVDGFKGDRRERPTESFAGNRSRRVSSRPVASAGHHLVLSRGWYGRPLGPPDSSRILPTFR